MNEAFEKILERLEESYIDCFHQGDYKFNNAIDKAEQIVQEVSEEFATDTNVGTNGWIACSDRLPEIDGNTSDIVLVCGSNGFQYMAFWCDDLKWRFCECGMAKNPILWTEIVAWQPLPEPYKESDE